MSLLDQLRKKAAADDAADDLFRRTEQAKHDLVRQVRSALPEGITLEDTRRKVVKPKLFLYALVQGHTHMEVSVIALARELGIEIPEVLR